MKMGAPHETAPEWPVAPGKRRNVKCCRSKSEVQAIAESIWRNGNIFWWNWIKTSWKFRSLLWEWRTTTNRPRRAECRFPRRRSGLSVLGQQMACRGGVWMEILWHGTGFQLNKMEDESMDLLILVPIIIYCYGNEWQPPQAPLANIAVFQQREPFF